MTISLKPPLPLLGGELADALETIFNLLADAKKSIMIVSVSENHS